MYAIDGSRRVNSNMFNKMRDFIQLSLQSYVISEPETHVGIIQYGDRAEIMIKPKDGISVAALVSTIQKLSRIGGARRMNKALRLVNSEIYSNPRESRSDAKRILVLLTTGKNSGDGSGELPRVARELRSEGVEIIPVVIGKDVDPTEIDAMSGEKGSSVSVEDANKLNEVIGQLEEKVNDAEGKGVQIYLCFVICCLFHVILEQCWPF